MPSCVSERAHAQVGDLQRHTVGMMAQQIFRAREALDVPVPYQLIHFLAFKEIEREIAFPPVRFQAQGRHGLVGQFASVLQAGYALVVAVDDRLRGRAVLAGLTCRQLFDDRSEYLDIGLLLVEAILVVGIFLRRDQRHGKRGQQHGDHDDAAC